MLFSVLLEAHLTVHSLLRGFYAFFMLLQERLASEPRAAHVRNREEPAAAVPGTQTPASRRLLHRATATYSLMLIWAFELLNYAVHVVLRPQPWNRLSQALGYALWGLQLWSLAACLLAEPARPSPEWVAKAEAGEEPSTTCPTTGQLLPPRACYVRRAGVVVLGFDHCEPRSSLAAP